LKYEDSLLIINEILIAYLKNINNEKLIFFDYRSGLDNFVNNNHKNKE